MSKRVFDDSKRMATGFSYGRESVKEVANELEIARADLVSGAKKNSPVQPGEELSEEQKKTIRLQKEKKKAQLQCDTLKESSSRYLGLQHPAGLRELKETE